METALLQARTFDTLALADSPALLTEAARDQIGHGPRQVQQTDLTLQTQAFTPNR